MATNSKTRFSITTVHENVEGETKSSRTRHYTSTSDKDDIIDWFEDKYRTDGMDRDNGKYFCTTTTSKGYTTYILEFQD